MRNEYDFSSGTENPYRAGSKVTVTLELSEETADYFEKLSQELGCPVSKLISSFLADCAERRLRPKTPGSKPTVD